MADKDIEQFRAHGHIRLKEWPTSIGRLYGSKEEYERLLNQQIGQLNDQQRLLYACNTYALLVIFQGMDTSGKDGAIRHVMSGVNPQGCQVFSFKQPSAEELDHDFLWRAARCLPERGRIGIFNRSYYEEVLIVRVHPQLLERQQLSSRLRESGKIWRERYRSILEFERHLVRNGTLVRKIFLHLSKEEQRQRFLARIDEPVKNWKFSLADVEERKYWKEYMKAYEKCLSATSTSAAPWYIVPADDKANARLIVSRIIVEALESLGLSYPKIGRRRRKELQLIRTRLAK